MVYVALTPAKLIKRLSRPTLTIVASTYPLTAYQLPGFSSLHAARKESPYKPCTLSTV